ncbi:SRPBCC family protein, partial [bacterium]
MGFTRHTAEKTVELDVPGGAFWAVLADWGALMDWIPKLDENPLVPITDCKLLPGHSADSLPCIRRVHLQGAEGQDSHLDEVLLHIDHETRRLYYSFHGVGPGGVRNYHATTYVDRLDGNRCRVTCASQFDLAAVAELDM